MNFKEYLKNLIATKQKRAEELKDKIKKAETADDVRNFGNELNIVETEIREAEIQLRAQEVNENELRNQFDPIAAYSSTEQTMNNTREETDVDPLGTMEYRTAFMNYVQKGTMSPILETQKRASIPNVASDLGVLLPSTTVQSIMTGIEKVYGQLYSRVRKTNIQGGVKYPIGSFNATFKRITESTVSERQNAGSVNGYVQFAYNIGEIRIAQTLLAAVLTVPAFEAEFSKVIVQAYVTAMDHEIMTGKAEDNQCEGILTEANKQSGRIAKDHIITFTAEEMADWKTWQKKLFAVIPLSMRGLRPEFAMTAHTYEANIKTLHDDNNRPLYVETYNPIDGTESASFKGRQVIFVENDILKDFDDASNDDYFGMYWVPEQAYAINTNLEFYVKRYFDDETNQYIDKAIVINDGKVLNPDYIYLLKKSES